MFGAAAVEIECLDARCDNADTTLRQPDEQLLSDCGEDAELASGGKIVEGFTSCLVSNAQLRP